MKCSCLQTQILEKDVITCDDALFSIREQIFRRKEDIKSDDLTRVSLTTKFKQFNLTINILIVFIQF